MVIARTVLPQPLNGTGQPCALTENVLATPKSLFDCITAGEKPIASSLAMTTDQRVPAPTRYVLPRGVGLEPLLIERGDGAVRGEALPAHRVARRAGDERTAAPRAPRPAPREDVRRPPAAIVVES